VHFGPGIAAALNKACLEVDAERQPPIPNRGPRLSAQSLAFKAKFVEAIPRDAPRMPHNAGPAKADESDAIVIEHEALGV
jgi:hypothetical protein